MQIKYLSETISHVLATRAHTAMKYVSPKLVVRVTRQLAGGRIPAKNRNIELIVTVGRPNFLERRFVKKCIKAGEKFPVRKIQVKFPRKKRK